MQAYMAEGRKKNRERDMRWINIISIEMNFCRSTEIDSILIYDFHLLLGK